mmetsp:Transcript_1551/g.3459  ORF Transcript_1551/g.3459 Transcript_1551/m.3459 type:complete len:236 (-) Transcript_1551:254-961(-)
MTSWPPSPSSPFSPLRYSMGSSRPALARSAASAEKYRHTVPTPPTFPSSSPLLLPLRPRSLSAAKPSVATTALAPKCSWPSAVLAKTPFPLSTTSRLCTLAFSLTSAFSSLAAIWRGTAEMPASGKQLDPVASIFMTNSKRREVVPRDRSKKMPPRKGRKNESTMTGENPSRTRCSAMVVSVPSKKMASSGLAKAWSRARPMRTLSTTEPTGLASESTPSTGCRSGSATRWKVPP